MKKLLLSGFLFCSLLGMANQEFPTPVAVLTEGTEMPDEWTEYTTIDGVKIEYKMKQCGGDDTKMRAQNLLLFKFTNTTDQELTISWVTQEFRNGQCSNCHNMYEGEFNRTLTLAAGEVKEGDGTTKESKELYLFGNYIKHVPGMAKQTLTNFELVDLTVR